MALDRHSIEKRDSLVSSAGEQVGAIIGAAEEMLQRLNAMEAELSSLIDGLRAALRQPASEEVESARLVALNMALDGTARTEADRYLAANFDLQDRQRLLDDVYASVEH